MGGRKMTLLCTGILFGIIFAVTLLYLIIELDELGYEFTCKVLYLLIATVIFACVLVIVGRSLGWNI